MKEFTEDDSKLPRFLFVMSHGQDGWLKDVNDDLYEKMKCIFEPFNSINAPHLEGILKFIVVQACR